MDAVPWSLLFEKYDKDSNDTMDFTEFVFLIQDALNVQSFPSNKTFEEASVVAVALSNHPGWGRNSPKNHSITLGQLIHGAQNGVFHSTVLSIPTLEPTTFILLSGSDRKKEVVEGDDRVMKKIKTWDSTSVEKISNLQSRRLSSAEALRIDEEKRMSAIQKMEVPEVEEERTLSGPSSHNSLPAEEWRRDACKSAAYLDLEGLVEICSSCCDDFPTSQVYAASMCPWKLCACDNATMCFPCLRISARLQIKAGQRPTCPGFIASAWFGPML